MVKSTSAKFWDLCISITIWAVLASKLRAGNPYKFFDWKISYGDIYPLGVRQQGILINGKFPGPDIYSQTNDNLIITVQNNLPEPFLLSWNGIQQRKNSYEDGVYGTTCPIPPGENFTYALQVKDQIGSFYYYPSLAFHKAAGGFGGLRVYSRPLIPVPFAQPAGDFTVLIGDWYKTDHSKLKTILDNGHKLPFPDGILINGLGSGSSFTFRHGKTYRLRISNVGLQNSLSFGIEGHQMKLIEVEGTHTLQNAYSLLDVHVGQSYSVLVTADQPPKDYHIIVTTSFTSKVLTSTAILHYRNSNSPVSGPIPSLATGDIAWSVNQARSIRTNLTASAPRPNPQGSYHYGSVKITRTIELRSSAGLIKGKQRYAVNGMSFVPADTPLKLADYFKINGVFKVGSIPYLYPRGKKMSFQTSVMGSNMHDFVEIVIQNKESIVQSWHLNGYNFWVVGMDSETWRPSSREKYNLEDAISRSTTQVYPKSWTAIYVALDNVGMWNMRSEFWARQYLGQQFYLRVYTTSKSTKYENPLPKKAILCGRAAKGKHT